MNRGSPRKFNRICKSAIVLMLLCTSTGVHASLIVQEIVVANRNSGTISVIDVATHTVTTHALPVGINTPEPMHVVSSANNQQVYVNDRANDRVVVFDALDYSVLDTIPTGAGGFHMWGEPAHNQLWVVNDVDKTITVIDTTTNSVTTTFSTPTDLNDAGGKPHDVILDPNGAFAYVTMIGVNGDDVVVKYSTTTFTEVDREAVGNDPHVSLSAADGQLFVPTQDGDEVTVLNRSDLSFVVSIPVPNAHGAGMAPDGLTFYTTNLAGGGTDALFTINTLTNMVVDVDDTPFAVPHNIAVSLDASELYITHSGATADTVSIFDLIDPLNPVFLMSVTVGDNPFGLVAVAKEVSEPAALLLLGMGLAGLGYARRRRLDS